MASDILGTVMGALGPEVIHKISGAIGEPQPNTQKALGAAVPAILAGLSEQASSGGSGLALIMSLLSSGKINSGMLDNLGSMLHGSSAASIMDAGRSVLTGAFGSKVGQAESLIANHAGVQAASAASILSMAGALVMAAIGKALGSPASTGSLTSLLSAQRASILGALPAGFGSLTAGMPMAAVAAPASSIGKWLWPVLLGLLAIIGAIWFFNRGSEVVTDTAKSSTAAVTDTANSAIAALGEFFKRKLPNGVELNIPKLGIENRLVDFIEDSSKPADKTTWFDFDRLLFDTGKATLQPSSQEQLSNIAAILKAYPKVQAKIGGYTDTVGDKDMNLQLSTDRAKNVMAELVKLGVDQARLTAEGYGEEHPVADNRTEEGRAKNRRISLRVTEK